MFRTAINAEQYFRGLNPTINAYEKTLYDMAGKAHVDEWAANHKIASNFFYFAVTQENQYLLGNGAIFGEEDTKGKLGNDFDDRLQEMGKYALIDGLAFGFFNLDHIEVFSLTEFVPLFDEENGALRAGVRFWQIDTDKPLRCTLYEMDGYTDYIMPSTGDMRVLKEKRPYKLKVRVSEADGVEIYDGENYPNFPIVPMWGNDKKQSELVGRRATLDAFDLLNSDFVNNVDEGNLIYWVIKNCGGMDDEDDAKFIERLKTTHVAHAGDGEQGADVESHTIEAPFTANEAAINAMKARLYEDFMCFNVSDLSAGSKTATEINAAYQLLDSKTDAFEYCVLSWIKGILEIAGIEDAASFTRSKVVNQTETVQTWLQCANYINSDTITEQICHVLGLSDQVTEILDRLHSEEQGMLTNMGDEEEEGV